MSEFHEVWCPDVIGLGFGVWENPIVVFFKRNPPQKWGVVHCREEHITMSIPIHGELLLNVVVSLLLIIIDEGAGDAKVRLVLLNTGLSEAVFKLLL